MTLFYTQNCTNVKCVLISCTVGQLERGKSAALKIRSRLWAQTFLEVMHTKISFFTQRHLHFSLNQIFKNTNYEIKWAKCKSFLLSLSCSGHMHAAYFSFSNYHSLSNSCPESYQKTPRLFLNTFPGFVSAFLDWPRSIISWISMICSAFITSSWWRVFAGAKW